MNTLYSSSHPHTLFHQDSYFGMGFVAFPATEYDEILLGYQPGQVVEW
jgi:hypothetical protein